MRESCSILTSGVWGGGRCGFQLVPAAVKQRVVVMGEEKPLLPQSRAFGLTGLCRRGCWGSGEQAPGSPRGDSALTAPHPPRVPWGGGLGSP